MCVCIILGSRNKNRHMAKVHSAIYYVQEPIYAVQSQRVVSFTPITLNLFQLCPKDQHVILYCTYKCHGQAWKYAFNK